MQKVSVFNEKCNLAFCNKSKWQSNVQLVCFENAIQSQRGNSNNRKTYTTIFSQFHAQSETLEFLFNVLLICFHYGSNSRRRQNWSIKFQSPFQSETPQIIKSQFIITTLTCFCYHHIYVLKYTSRIRISQRLQTQFIDNEKLSGVQ